MLRAAQAAAQQQAMPRWHGRAPPQHTVCSIPRAPSQIRPRGGEERPGLNPRHQAQQAHLAAAARSKGATAPVAAAENETHTRDNTACPFDRPMTKRTHKHTLHGGQGPTAAAHPPGRRRCRRPPLGVGSRRTAAPAPASSARSSRVPGPRPPGPTATPPRCCAARQAARGRLRCGHSAGCLAPPAWPVHAHDDSSAGVPNAWLPGPQEHQK